MSRYFGESKFGEFEKRIINNPIEKTTRTNTAKNILIFWMKGLLQALS
jgi:hypothetical protein